MDMNEKKRIIPIMICLLMCLVVTILLLARNLNRQSTSAEQHQNEGDYSDSEDKHSPIEDDLIIVPDDKPSSEKTEELDIDVTNMGRNPEPEVVDTEIRIDTKEDEDGAQ